jgi:prepilin-type N-terminal cleavage/methylation domain-containing protein
MSADRRGFTLIELLVVAVLGALLVVASYKVLITNQRTYTAQNARIAGQQISRAALDVLTAELREINPSDLMAIGDEQVTFRAQRSFGLACAVTLGNPPTVTTRRVGDWFEVGDSVFVYADNQTTTPTDDAWIPAQITAADTAQSCSSEPAERLSFAGQQTAFLADTVRQGAPVRSFVRYTYGRFDLAGGSYIARQVDGGSVEPLVGPVPASFATGVPTLEFIYMDGAGAVTTTPADVEQIEVHVRVRSDATDAQGDMIADSLMTRVYLRN